MIRRSAVLVFLAIPAILAGQPAKPLDSFPAKYVIARDDSVYECFPDVVLLKSGRLVLVYRESDSHSASDFTRVVYRTSDNRGMTWSEKHVLSDHKKTQKPDRKGGSAGSATQKPDPPTQRPDRKGGNEGGVLAKWNCPRVGQLRDGRVYILCDLYNVPPGEKAAREYSKVWFWYSSDNADTFGEPSESAIVGIVPDKICELPEGAWLVAAHQKGENPNENVQRVYRSDDRGKSWQGPYVVAAKAGLSLCEASILRLTDGTLVAYMRENSSQGLPAFKSFSADGGRTWEGPFETLMDGAHRPVAGFLASGKVMMTYRLRPRIGGGRNTMAFLEGEGSARTRDWRQQNGIVLPLDHDRRWPGDTGYTGWVQFPDGEILVVNYIVDDAPKAQIRGYRLRESDF
jgi:sialidase-1